jgi:hypothetical protein
MQGCYRLFFRGVEGFYWRCRTTCLILHGRGVVLELLGLALFHLSQVDENFRWLILVSLPSTTTLYDFMSALNAVRHWYRSGYLMPVELAATVEEESRDSR